MERHLSEGVCLAVALEIVSLGKLSPQVFTRLPLGLRGVLGGKFGWQKMSAPTCKWPFCRGSKHTLRHVKEHLSVHQAYLSTGVHKRTSPAGTLEESREADYLVNAGDMAARCPTLACVPCMRHAFLTHPVLNSHPVLLWPIPLPQLLHLTCFPQHSRFPLVSVLVYI